MFKRLISILFGWTSIFKKRKTVYCKDCRHFVIADYKGSRERYRYGRCICPKNLDVPRITKDMVALNLVADGDLTEDQVRKQKEKRYRFVFATSQRADGWLGSFVCSTCGQKGKWFEPKEEPKGVSNE